jgi:hypothetical protein
MSRDDTLAFEAIAGDLLAELGYELLEPDSGRRGARAALPLNWYRLRMGAWNAAAYAAQRSPLWRRRHPHLFS